MRCDATHIGTEWQFEILSEKPPVAVATIVTADGPVHVGLNRQEAQALAQKLQLFLIEWPEARSGS